MATISVLLITLTIYGMFFVLSVTDKKYRNALFWFVFYLYFFKPFLSRLTGYMDGTGAIATFDVLSVITALLYPVTLLWYIFLYREKFFTYLRNSRILQIVLILVAVYFLEVFNPTTSIARGFLSFKHIIFILYSFIGALLIYDPVKHQRFIRSLLMFGIIYVLYGIWQAWFGLNAFENHWLAMRDLSGGVDYVARQTLGGQLRPFSFANTEGHFLYTVVFIALFCLAQLQYLSPNNKRLIAFYMFLMVLLFSKVPDRTPILLFLIGLSVLYIYRKRHNKGFRITIFSVTAISMLVSLRLILIPVLNSGELADNLLLHRLVELIDIFQAGTWLARSGPEGAWLISLSLIGNSIFFGYGTGSGSYTRSVDEVGSVFHATHSEYLSILMDTGIIGFSIFVIIIVMLFRSIFGLLKTPYALIKRSTLSTLVVLVPALALMVTNLGMLMGESSRLIWFFFGLIPFMEAELRKIEPNKRKVKLSY